MDEREFIEELGMEQTPEGEIREETLELVRVQDWLLNGTSILACQRKCLNFRNEIISKNE